MDVLEYLGYATVLVNCLFLYWFRMDFIEAAGDFIDIFHIFFPDSVNTPASDSTSSLIPVLSNYINVTDIEMLNFTLLIIMTEHAIVFTKYLMMEIIGETPTWVEKNTIKIINQTEKMML